MASAYSTPNPKPATPETTTHHDVEEGNQPASGSNIDIALVGGLMLVASLVVVLVLFFMVYWDILVSATQYPLAPSR
jgi:hypothetical protein